jgi:hypothetical protein
MIAYLKSFAVGIAAAGTVALLVFIVRMYSLFETTPVDVHVTDFYLPKWIPLDAMKVLAAGMLYTLSHISVLLAVLAFVLGFCWELDRV